MKKMTFGILLLCALSSLAHAGSEATTKIVTLMESDNSPSNRHPFDGAALSVRDNCHDLGGEIAEEGTDGACKFIGETVVCAAACVIPQAKK